MACIVATTTFTVLSGNLMYCDRQTQTLDIAGALTGHRPSYTSGALTGNRPY